MKPELTQIIFDACEDKKANDITLLNLNTIQSYAEYVYVVSATSDKQAQTIADHILDMAIKHASLSPIGVEGYETGQWILVDFGSVVCHIFLEDLREEYRLEDLWAGVTPLKAKDIAVAVSQ